MFMDYKTEKGSFGPSPWSSPLGRGRLLKFSRELRKNQTQAEQALWEILRARRFKGLKFRRQHQIGLYIVDFYCHSLKLVIELDGGYHQTVKQKAKDRIRDKTLKAEGFHVLRFSNITAIHKPKIILKAIKTHLSPRERQG